MPIPWAPSWKTRTAAAVLLLSTLALGILGLDRSLWLDETWVANSVIEPTLSEMFYYPGWLQSTPPLFLLFMRTVVHAFGVSNAAFRIVPLAFGLLGVAGMIALTRRLLSLPFAALACVLLAFHPTAIEYAHSAKQYSAELAASVAILLATCLYLECPTWRRLAWLTAAFVLCLPLAWSTAFLLPGAAIAVWANGGWRRAAALTMVFGAELALVYFAFIRQNVSAELRAFWIATAQKPSHGLIAVLVFCAAAMVIALFRRSWIRIAALLPILLLAAADLLHLYPVEPRTRLFALPCFLLVAAMTAEDLWGWLIRSIPGAQRFARFANATLLLVAAGIGFTAISRQSRAGVRPEEDLQGAVRLLRQSVTARDLLLVHPSVIEGFRLYAVMEGWRDDHATFGKTGWPCCARGENAAPNSSKVDAVIADIDRMVPRGFSGRVWELYSARHSHWVYIGNDEGYMWRQHLLDRGCAAGPYLILQNIIVSVLDCRPAT